MTPNQSNAKIKALTETMTDWIEMAMIDSGTRLNCCGKPQLMDNIEDCIEDGLQNAVVKTLDDAVCCGGRPSEQGVVYAVRAGRCPDQNPSRHFCAGRGPTKTVRRAARAMRIPGTVLKNILCHNCLLYTSDAADE